MKKIVAFTLSVLCLFACMAVPAYAAQRPWPTESFLKGTPMPWYWAPLLEGYCVVQGIRNGNVFNDSVMVYHKGEVIYERYARGWDKDTTHQMYSVTKSVLSALVGVAIADGKIKSVDQKVAGFFKGLTIPAGQESKRDITIEHLLRQTSGLPGDDDNEANGVAWWEATDSGKACFLIPQVAKPGERFAYSSGPGMQTLSALLTNAVGENLFSYAKRKLFGPLGMTSVKWDAAADGVNYGGFGLSMTPRDMARFGYLFLNNGKWNGRQIIPAAYVAACKPRRALGENYGYLFWGTSDLKYFETVYDASGSFGNFIFIIPDWDMVIVRTGSAGPTTRAVAKGMMATDIVRKIFMTLVYPLVPLKGVPLEYFMEHLGT
jgi:CubicO group peptidase (beta-lactamase class C family)